MENVIAKSKIVMLEELLLVNETVAAVTILKKMPEVEVAEVFMQLPPEQVMKLIPLFSLEELGDVFTNIDINVLVDLFEHIDRKMFGKIFTNMSSDIRADLYQELEKDKQLELLPFLDKATRADVIHLSSYPDESAGSIMVTDFATVRIDMTVGRAIEKVREDAPSKKMIYYVYVVDKQMRMQGFITLKDLIMAEPETLVSEILHSEYVWADVFEDRESVAKKIEKYDMIAIPVLNTLHQLVGIVRHDEAIDIIRAEHTEDLEKFMGIVPSEEELNYMQTSTIGHFKKRVIWLVVLAIIGILSGMIIHSYENAMAQLLILALYMPMIADSGGNAGSQAATVVVRALALGQITVANWIKILFKEARISLLLSACLGAIAFIKILFLSWETDIPEQFSLLYLAFGISLALCLQVITSTLVGAGLPLLVKRFGGDPAVAASPAITTMVDITGLLIYFGLATWLFF